MKTAVLVIDIQQIMLDENPYRIDTLLDTVERVCREARRIGIEVITVQHNGAEGSDLEPGKAAWELVEQVKPLPGELLIQKEFNSAFRKTLLDQELKARDVDCLVIMGLQTEYCIDTTIRVAFEKGYRVLIPEMSNSTFDNGSLKAEEIVRYHNKQIFHGRFGSLISVEGLFEQWKDRGDR